MSKKIALITGGSRGLGKSMAMHLAESGNDIVITYNSKKELAEQVVKEIEMAGQKAMALQYDSSDFESLDNFVKQFTESLQNKWNVSSFDS